MKLPDSKACLRTRQVDHILREGDRGQVLPEVVTVRAAWHADSSYIPPEFGAPWLIFIVAVDN